MLSKLSEDEWDDYYHEEGEKSAEVDDESGHVDHEEEGEETEEEIGYDYTEIHDGDPDEGSYPSPPL